MIEGLHIDVPGAEVRELLQKRATYFQERHRFYVQQLAQLETALGPADLAAGRFNVSSMRSDPRDALKSKVRQHARSLRYTRFLADHSIVGETYRLSTSDLERLGILEDGDDDIE